MMEKTIFQRQQPKKSVFDVVTRKFSTQSVKLERICRETGNVQKLEKVLQSSGADVNKTLIVSNFAFHTKPIPNNENTKGRNDSASTLLSPQPSALC